MLLTVDILSKHIVCSGGAGSTGFPGFRGGRGPVGDTGATGATGLHVQGIHRRVARQADGCPGKLYFTGM